MIERRIEQFLLKQVADGAFPGAAFAVGTASSVYLGAVGHHRYDQASPAVCWEMRWDMASVTKVMATTSAAYCLLVEGKLAIERPVKEYLPEFRHDAVTIGHLLRHDSGLPAYFNFQTSCKTPAESRSRLFKIDLRKAAGAETVYSCIGFCTLKEVIESVAGEPLDRFVEKRVFAPLGMRDTGYLPETSILAQIPPTEKLAPWRKTLEDAWGIPRAQDDFIQGGVHDPAAFMMGGVSGNAGLFSSAPDVARFAQAYLSERVFPAKEIASWTSRQSAASSRALGWDTKSPTGSSAGSRFSLRSFGHTGYTGTSLWIDPELKMFGALLTNRVHPTSENDRILKVRPRFYDLVAELLGH